MRGSSRLRVLERKVRCRGELQVDPELLDAHEWLWQNERWDLFDPLLPPAEDYLDALEANDEEGMAEAAERVKQGEEKLLAEYRAYREENIGQT